MWAERARYEQQNGEAAPDGAGHGVVPGEGQHQTFIWNVPQIPRDTLKKFLGAHW